MMFLRWLFNRPPQPQPHPRPEWADRIASSRPVLCNYWMRAPGAISCGWICDQPRGHSGQHTWHTHDGQLQASYSTKEAKAANGRNAFEDDRKEPGFADGIRDAIDAELAKPRDDLDDYLAEQLRDPEFAAAWGRAQARMAMAAGLREAFKSGQFGDAAAEVFAEHPVEFTEAIMSLVTSPPADPRP